MPLGDNIRKLRKEKKMTQRELAESVNSDASYINRLETGKINPSITSLEKIAEVFECSLDFLVKGHQDDEEVHIHDKSLSERIKLIDSMDEDDKKALTHIIDALLTKRKIRELLAQSSPVT